MQKPTVTNDMKEFTVMTDINTDIDASYAEAEHIVILPQYYHFNDGVIYGDEQKLEPPVFYKRLLEGERAYSMGCNPERVRELFEAELDAGRDILCIMFSSELSGSYSTVSVVAQELMGERDCRICVIDSLNGSVAAGLMVYLAQEMKKQGHTLEEVRDAIEARKKDFDILFLVDHLDCLVRGGRLNAVSGAVGTVLNIKPILHFEEGKIVSFLKCRGKNNAKRTMLDTMKKLNLDKTLVAVAHSDNLEEAKEFAAEVEAELGVKVVYINEINLTIGTHTGPDAIGVAFCKLPDKEN